ncbi:PP2C family protein-serine/threonine phosphatase [Streptomyces sp. NPDC047315]|uniref:PP2C family protein-serine/threonine phosphatase n=1 Tax=Streptomyces sp. NPDC047315 TaxID=3155142 RepID=UPI0033D6A96B
MAPIGKTTLVSAPHFPKVAGIDSSSPHSPHTAAPSAALAEGVTATPSDRAAPDEDTASAESAESAAPAAKAGSDDAAEDGSAHGAPRGTALHDRLAGWVSELTTLHELTERLAATRSLEAALDELLRAGAALIGARRGLAVLEPPTGPGNLTNLTSLTSLTRGYGLSHAELGHIETVPRALTAYGRILEGRRDPAAHYAAHSAPNAAPAPSAVPNAVAHPDILGDATLDPVRREVALRLGCAAAYTQPLASEAAGTLGAAVWLYDEPAAPVERRRHLMHLYVRYATEHLARLIEVARARQTVATIAEELLPSRLPRVPGVRLAARHRTGPLGGGDWYDALPLPDGALGLAVGSVSGAGPSALGAMGRLRASLRAYAVMEGEDPVAVLSDLELLLRLTEPARTATALFAYAEPAAGKVVLAGAGHTPPLVIGDRRTEFVETSLSAPLGMLSCWEAPSTELCPQPGETVLLYTDGLLRRGGDPMDRAFARLHAAAASVPRAAREDPGAIADHVLRAMVPAGADGTDDTDGADVVLLAARFD